MMYYLRWKDRWKSFWFQAVMKINVCQFEGTCRYKYLFFSYGFVSLMFDFILLFTSVLRFI
ncbi:hypothetical protein Hanom_Chr07g00636311 [Helianthus anomalus]